MKIGIHCKESAQKCAILESSYHAPSENPQTCEALTSQSAIPVNMKNLADA